jgi:hypothetical protein
VTLLATAFIIAIAAGFIAALLAGRERKHRRGLLTQVREGVAEIIEEVEAECSRTR